MSNQDDVQYYASYGGLGRVALMWGVPLLPFLLLVFMTLFGLMLGFICWGFLVGVALAAVPLLLIGILKIICELDDRAAEIFRWKIRGFLSMLPNLLAGHPIIRVGIRSNQAKQRRQLAYQFFKEHRG